MERGGGVFKGDIVLYSYSDIEQYNSKINGEIFKKICLTNTQQINCRSIAQSRAKSKAQGLLLRNFTISLSRTRRKGGETHGRIPTN